MFSCFKGSDDLLASVRQAVFVALLTVPPLGSAATYYDPVWGPAPPATPAGKTPLPAQHAVAP